MCGNGSLFEAGSDSEDVIPALFDPRKPPGLHDGNKITDWINSYSDEQFQDPSIVRRALLRQEFCLKVDGQHRIADVEVRSSVKEW